MTEETVFAAALEKTNPTEQAAFLDQACAGDDALRARVETLLRSHPRGNNFPTQPGAEHGRTGTYMPHLADDDPSASPPSPADAAGTRIGPYQLVEKLGEGGMGAVYLAEQEQPVRRRVALKIVKAGMDSAPILARFEQERQALALMDHPNIARVLDAGTTEAGRPYFVMELVQGVAITDFCDREKLMTRERLQLFLPVCRAVQHAHQKGIIHRDLKPSNVLVALYDGRPVPKVIDFGVAKATGPSPAEDKRFTAVGQVIGTPEYMSPEQAEPGNLDIDTRTDIYSLGVLLYELLTGSTPLCPRRHGQPAFTELLRIIREEEPERPSARLSQGGEALPTIAALRQTEPRTLSKLVTGDLDWIVMKALAKERDRRYETASALALDIQRYLADEPVLAGPPSVGYRVRKFVRRHRGQVIAAALVLAALVAGIVGTTAGMIRAWRAEAGSRDALAAETRSRARTREALNAMTDDVIEKLFTQQPKLGGNEKAFLRKVLAYYEEFAREQGETEAARAVAAGGQLRVAKVRAVLGERREAEEGYRAAIGQYEQLLFESPDVPPYRFELALSHNNLGVLLVELGKRPEAAAAYRQALGLHEKLAAEFPTVPEYRRQLAVSQHNLGVVLRELKDRQAAEAAYRRALELRQQLMSAFPEDPAYRQELAGTHLNLGILLREMGRNDAEPEYRRSLELREKLVAENPAVGAYRHDLALTYNSLGILLYGLKKRPDAEAAFRRALELQEKVAAEFPALPDYRIDLAGSYVNFGRLIRDDGRALESLDWFAKAIPLLEGILEQDARVSAARSFLRNAYANRAESLDRLNRYGEAVAAWDRAIELDEGSMRSRFRLPRAYGLSRSGKHREASAAVDELAQIANLDGATLFNLACVEAQCAAAARDDPALRESYAARAFALLGRARSAGYFKDATGIDQLRKDGDLDALRGRDEYRQMLQELEAGQGGK
jgi:eukaryotic-like serine/threonine-protein kinase